MNNYLSLKKSKISYNIKLPNELLDISNGALINLENNTIGHALALVKCKNNDVIKYWLYDDNGIYSIYGSNPSEVFIITNWEDVIKNTKNYSFVKFSHKRQDYNETKYPYDGFHLIINDNINDIDYYRTNLYYDTLNTFNGQENFYVNSRSVKLYRTMLDVSLQKKIQKKLYCLINNVDFFNFMSINNNKDIIELYNNIKYFGSYDMLDFSFLKSSNGIIKDYIINDIHNIFDYNNASLLTSIDNYIHSNTTIGISHIYLSKFYLSQHIITINNILLDDHLFVTFSSENINNKSYIDSLYLKQYMYYENYKKINEILPSCDSNIYIMMYNFILSINDNKKQRNLMLFFINQLFNQIKIFYCIGENC